MGAGAGCTVEIDGIELNLQKAKFISRKGTVAYFDIPLKKGIVDYWKAEGYYDGVDSDGVYYDGALMLDYGKEDRKIEGGIAHCSLDFRDKVPIDDEDDSISNEEIIELLNEQVESYIGISCVYGGGWSHVNLPTKSFVLESNQYSSILKSNDYQYWGFDIESIEIEMPNMAEDVNWFFENVNDFEEIFFGGDDEFEESKKSNKKTLKERKLTLKEIKDYIRTGYATDITEWDWSDVEKLHLSVIGISTGTYGMNGGLFEDSEGNLYAITKRNTLLFRLF